MNPYLIDTNFFITAHRAHYPMDVVPSFWSLVQRLAQQGLICSIDKVKNEISRGNDELTEWIDNHLPSTFFKNSAVTIGQYAQVAVWANSKSKHYSVPALNEFLDADEADAWLIAMAMKGGHTIVTHEVSNPKMQRRIAIPEPCNHFGVSFCDTITMFRRMGVTF